MGKNDVNYIKDLNLDSAKKNGTPLLRKIISVFDELDGVKKIWGHDKENIGFVVTHKGKQSHVSISHYEELAFRHKEEKERHGLWMERANNARTALLK